MSIIKTWKIDLSSKEEEKVNKQIWEMIEEVNKDFLKNSYLIYKDNYPFEFIHQKPFWIILIELIALEDKDYDILKVELYDNKDIVITLYTNYTKNDFDVYKLKELVSKLRKNKK